MLFYTVIYELNLEI